MSAVTSIEKVGRGHVPPHDLDAEAAVISATILRPNGWDDVAALVTPEMFYSEAHRRIVEAIRHLRTTGVTVDTVAVASRLKDTGRLAQVGGWPYLTAVIAAAPAVGTDHLQGYARTVRDHHVVRQVIARCTEAAARGYVGVPAVGDFLEDIARDLHELTALRHAGTSSFVGLGELAVSAYQRMQKLGTGVTKLAGTPTGFHRLDDNMGGIHGGDLTVVAARPAMGKTAFVLNIADHIARNGDGVAFLSLEMPKEQLANRVMCARADANVLAARTGAFTRDEWSRLAFVVDHLRTSGMVIDDRPKQSIAEVVSNARRLKQELANAGKPLRLLAIDYLQIMKVPERRDGSQTLAIGEITSTLKATAKELDVGVVLLSQLNRQVESRQEKRPQMSDLRDSGSIEQDADNILFLYRDEYYNAESAKGNVAEVIIAKQRNGPTGTVDLRFDKHATAFRNLPADWEGA